MGGARQVHPHAVAQDGPHLPSDARAPTEPGGRRHGEALHGLRSKGQNQVQKLESCECRQISAPAGWGNTGVTHSLQNPCLFTPQLSPLGFFHPKFTWCFSPWPPGRGHTRIGLQWDYWENGQPAGVPRNSAGVMRAPEAAPTQKG